MKHVFCIIIVLSSAASIRAHIAEKERAVCVNSAPDHPVTEVGINIYPTIVEDILHIDISDEHVGRITVSIFNSVGRIVIGQLLRKGSNEVDANSLAEGEYVAVVRVGGVYRSKLRFEVRGSL